MFLAVLLGVPALADDGDRAAAIVEKAARRSTLDQQGTHPFHLKAAFAPSQERDKDSGRTGEIEIWWQSTTAYRRELRSPGFHRIEIVNGSQRWQKNEGDYYPAWLNELAVALINPLPNLDHVLAMVRQSDIKHMAGTMYCQWSVVSTDGTTKMGVGASVAVNDSTGLIFYAGEPGWGGQYSDYKDFHGRAIARTVGNGTPETTAHVTILEDLHPSAEMFNSSAPGSDSQLLEIVTLDEVEARRNLKSAPPITWPIVDQGAYEGTLTTSVAIDRQGNVREVGTIVATNNMVVDAARAGFSKMQFEPFVRNGVPIEVFTRITLPFKLPRPKEAEGLDNVTTYIERARKSSFLYASAKTPYKLQAEFSTRISDGSVATGQYEDIFVSPTQWRREAKVGKSLYIRARNGDTFYKQEEGPDAKLLSLVLLWMEPLPAPDTYYEVDWKLRRDPVGSIPAVRALFGPSNPDGTLDPTKVREAYWFDERGLLIKSLARGLEARRSQFEQLDGVQLAHNIDIYIGDKAAMYLRVTNVETLTNLPSSMFVIAAHEWKRGYSGEDR
ncbi:MAG TPA: hypothetical protein VMU24_05285 [Candidatus Acidoferrales bacterium]|nr:hypothetical protein [Candidatus Acidoferrales bacterium]